MRSYKQLFMLCVVAGFIGAMAALAVLVQTAHAHTGSPSPTTWSNGNTLTAQALNDTVAHLHNTFSAGIVDAHVSTSAAISHSKMATPSLLPKVWGVVTATCSGSPCTVAAGSGVTSVTRSGPGDYVVNLTATRANAAYLPIANSITTNVHCISKSLATGSFGVDCRATSTNAATDAAFGFSMYDNDN